MTRIIPARAGSTNSPPCATGSRKDHPRSRGEHAQCVVVTVGVFGSSPLARGARRPCPARSQPSGIIPARAGSTYDGRDRVRGGGDHPRSRGEHAPGASSFGSGGGSSPLARGARRGSGRDPGRGRIIPARAGSTQMALAGRATTPDHPRSRGEHSN